MESVCNVMIVTLNVGGVKHEVLRSSLERHPHTRLGRLLQCNTHQAIVELCDHYKIPENEYFFDRRPQSFSAILDFYRTGKLHLADDTCVVAFSDDLKYWGVDEVHLEPCCQYKYGQAMELLRDEMRKEAEFVRQQEDEREEFGDSRHAGYRKFIWNLLDKSNMSLTAKLMAVLSILFTIVFTVTLLLDTLPQLMEMDQYNYLTGNSQLAIVLMLCVAWFLLEYLTKLATAPRKLKFLIGFLNVIDLLVIVAYLTSFAFSYYTLCQDILQMIQVLKIITLVRFLKLFPFSDRLQTLCLTPRNSCKELAVLFLYYTMAVVIFSTLAYLAERDEHHTSFNNIPESFWWAIITLTTVGYGDVLPTTARGRAIGAICSVCGVLLIALAISIVTSNFARTSKDLIRRKKSIKRKRDTTKDDCPLLTSTI